METVAEVYKRGTDQLCWGVDSVVHLHWWVLGFFFFFLKLGLFCSKDTCSLYFSAIV